MFISKENCLQLLKENNEFLVLSHEHPDGDTLGCAFAMCEILKLMGKKRAFIVTDTFLYQNGYTKPITDKLDEMGIVHASFFNVEPDPTLACAKEGAAQMYLPWQCGL